MSDHLVGRQTRLDPRCMRCELNIVTSNSWCQHKVHEHEERDNSQNWNGAQLMSRIIIYEPASKNPKRLTDKITGISIDYIMFAIINLLLHETAIWNTDTWCISRNLVVMSIIPEQQSMNTWKHLHKHLSPKQFSFRGLVQRLKPVQLPARHLAVHLYDTFCKVTSFCKPQTACLCK